MNQNVWFKKKLLASAVATCVLSGISGAAIAQDQERVVEEVLVTGIRQAMTQAMDLKRDATGVVDAISAEDMGKFPDTNLAESLQRVTGVSIDRQNGEGSEVTVRGFGGGDNLVTLNGRHMPSANVAVVGGDQDADFATGAGRSFDFSNLASEGVSALEVYKTGRASIPTGGIGATINIKTLRPFDKPGLQGSVGIKGVHDTTTYYGDKVTPEVSGLISWTDDEDRFGVSLFASYQDRQNGLASATSNAWNIRTYEQFLNPNSGFYTEDTVVSNPPIDRDTLVSIPNDSRWHYSEIERERLNGMLTLQFRPMENLTLTADALMARNTTSEERSDQTNWFNRPFGYVEFDENPVVATAVYLEEDIAGVKDTGFEQQYRATEDTMSSFAFNADWQASDELNVVFDFHSSETESTPNSPGGYSAVLTAIAAPVVTSHSLDWRRTGFPVQEITINDSLRDTFGTAGGTNANGMLDEGDLGSQIARTVASEQSTKIDQMQLFADYDLDFSVLEVGVDYRAVEMQQRRVQQQQTLGNWGIENPGDVPEDLVETFCLACMFDDFEPHATGASQVAFRGNAEDLLNALSPVYAAQDRTLDLNGFEDNVVEEDIFGAYIQMTFDGELADREWELLAGLRYEETEVTSTSFYSPDEAIVWVSDNDFTIRAGAPADGEYRTETGSYDNLLPSLDLSYSLTENLKARASWSKTIARPGYGDLFVADNADAPDRPIATGGQATGTSGNPNLGPLESTNIDLSLEWYYNDSSYVSFGYFDKQVKNFIGSGVEERGLFGLRDPSSGEPGTRSGRAAELLQDQGLNRSDVNLFTMTALLDNMTEAEALSTFQDNVENGALTQAFVDSTLAAYDIEANASDPLYEFAVQIPVNTRTGNIYGFEFAWQHFFGESGFGYQANYTVVNGDVGIDVGASPSENQFALLGLSDSANLSLIYEDHGLSARLAYNWRDTFLSATNRGGDRNPVFVRDYGQLDMNLSYELTDNLVLMAEGLNLSGSNTRTFGRDYSNVWMMAELGPRYMLGARYTF